MQIYHKKHLEPNKKWDTLGKNGQSGPGLIALRYRGRDWGAESILCFAQSRGCTKPGGIHSPSRFIQRNPKNNSKIWRFPKYSLILGIQLPNAMPSTFAIMLARDTSLLMETPSLCGLQPIFDC
jgi:hypothetical protein